MANMNWNELSTIVKVGAVTAAGAFFGALTLTQMPTTLQEWKAALAPALGAAIAAELVYLKSTVGQLVNPPAPTSPPPPAAHP